MAPERLLGIRDDPRSDLFSLGVLLYFFTTGERPFGESETLRGMKRRLWRDAHPPRKLRLAYAPRAGSDAAVGPRPTPAAQAEVRLSALAPGNRAAVPGDRAGVAPPYGFATCIRARSSRPGQTDRAVGAAQARSAEHRAAPPLQSRADVPESKIRSRGATGLGSDRGRRARSCRSV